MTKSHGNHGKKVYRLYSSCIARDSNTMDINRGKEEEIEHTSYVENGAI